jgi:hypothetical protein
LDVNALIEEVVVKVTLAQVKLDCDHGQETNKEPGDVKKHKNDAHLDLVRPRDINVLPLNRVGAFCF